MKSSYLSRLDLYGEPIGLTLGSKDKFKTKIGALISILVVLICGGYTAYLVLKMINYEDY
jgi:hypothetical protein